MPAIIQIQSIHKVLPWEQLKIQQAWMQICSLGGSVPTQSFGFNWQVHWRGGQTQTKVKKMPSALILREAGWAGLCLPLFFFLDMKNCTVGVDGDECSSSNVHVRVPLTITLNRTNIRWIGRINGIRYQRTGYPCVCTIFFPHRRALCWVKHPQLHI